MIAMENVSGNFVLHELDYSSYFVLLRNIRKALKAGGVLVCEFGAVGNIETINRAFSEQALLYGYPCKSRFNFRGRMCFRYAGMDTMRRIN